MDLPINQFKRRLLARETQFGLWLGLASGFAAEVVADSGFDWLLIDGEHAPNDLRSIREQLQTLAAYSASPIVRAVKLDAALIKQLLDVGAQTLLLPMIDTPEQAEQAVAAMHYPPRGIRGVGTGLARAAHWNGIDNYLHRASDELCLICQVESVTALENIEAICAVDGVDAIFIGPSDLAASMGHLGNPGHPDVRAAVADAIARVHACGKPVGMFGMGAESARHFAAEGVEFVAAAVDALLLRQSACALVEQLRKPTDGNDSEAQLGY
jgi:4-hydroxy-2-oxoheptanedioate aldolase